MGESDEVLPAGAYCVETDEELLEDISFPGYRRILTLIHLNATSDHPGVTRTVTIDGNELDAALKRDQAPPAVPTDTDIGRRPLKVTPETCREKADQDVDRAALQPEPGSGGAL